MKNVLEIHQNYESVQKKVFLSVDNLQNIMLTKPPSEFQSTPTLIRELRSIFLTGQAKTSEQSSCIEFCSCLLNN